MGDDGSKIRMRTAINDMRGRIAELLAKAINQGSLDRELTAADRESLTAAETNFEGLIQRH